MEIREMTKQEMKMFLHLKTASKEQEEEIFSSLCSYPGGWVLQAIEKRFSFFEFKVDKKTMIMLLLIGDGIIGKCVKYVDDIIEISKKLGIDNVVFETFAMRVYPMGFPVL